MVDAEMNPKQWTLGDGRVVPVVQGKITLSSKLSRGRNGLGTGQYRPHIVVEPWTEDATVQDGKVITDNYLGVMFVGGPDALEPGESAEVSLALMYYPHEAYSKIVP